MWNLTLNHCQPPSDKKGQIDQILLKAEFFAGLAMEGQVQQWNWYLAECLCDQDVVTKTTCTEEIALLPIIPIPKSHTPPLKEALWEPREWSQHFANARFTGWFINHDRTKTTGNQQPIDWGWNGQY